MPNFAVCSNRECKLSCDSKELDVLHGLIVAAEARQRQKPPKDISDLRTKMEPFKRFFQFDGKCSLSECRKPLHPVGRPTEDADLTRLLKAGAQLQAWGVL